MGIPLYFHKITKNHSSIISATAPHRCDRLFLDFNGIIHTSYHALKNNVSVDMSKNDFENHLIDKVMVNTLQIIDYVKPSQLVSIDIDGVAPLPKILQQRKRRYLSAWMKTQIKEDGYVWDSNAISPGTPFMKKLSDKLKSLQTPFKLIISDSSDVGEGEHKIFNYIRSNNETDIVDIIYGLDADLIMLSMLCDKTKKYLLREPQHYGKQGANHSAPFLWFNVDACREAIVKSYKDKIDINSYVILCSLIGNDFLPCLSYLNIHNDGIETIMKSYSQIYDQYGMRVVDYDSEIEKYVINYDVIGLLLEDLMRYENSECKRLHDQNYKKNMVFNSHKMAIENYGVNHKNMKLKSMFENNNWRLQYYTHLFDMNPHNDTTINDATSQYIKGLQWMVDYYINKEFNNNWWYTYNYSPTILDAYNYVEVNKKDLHTNSGNNLIINEDLQLLMIIPCHSVSVLPEHLQNLVNNDMSIGYLYPIEFEIETYMKSKLHECSPILPQINLSDLQVSYLKTIS